MQMLPLTLSQPAIILSVFLPPSLRMFTLSLSSSQSLHSYNLSLSVSLIFISQQRQRQCAESVSCQNSFSLARCSPH